MSARQQSIQQRYSSKKDYSLNSFDNGHIQQQSSVNGNPETIETTCRPPIHSLGKEGLEDYVLANLKTLGSHFPDNPEIPNIVTLIKKGIRKERLNELDRLAKERRKKQKQQQSPVPRYMGHIYDDDLLIKSQERLRAKYNVHDPRRNKNVKMQDYQEDDWIGVNQEKPVQMNDYTVDRKDKDFDTNRQPLVTLPNSRPHPSAIAAPTIATATPSLNVVSRIDNDIEIRNLGRLQESMGNSTRYDSRNIHSYMNYKAKLQEKTRRKQEFELIRKQVIREETNRRLRQLEEFRRKQRKEKMAQLDVKNRELKLDDDDYIDDEYKEIRKQQRRERMAEIARQSRNPSINDSREQDDEDLEYWENLTPDSIGWKEFLSLSKENDKSRVSCWTLNTDQPDKYQENISKALAPELSFKHILKERYTLQPVIGNSEELQQVRDNKVVATNLSCPKENKSDLAKLAAALKSQETKLSLDKKQLQQTMREKNQNSKPLLKPTQPIHLEGGPDDIPPSIAKVRGWLKHFEDFDDPEKIENNPKVPSSNHSEEDNSSSEDFPFDNEISTMRNSKSLLALLSKIRSTKRKINSRDKVALERHRRTLEVMQRIITDLIDKHEEIVERDKKIKDGKKHLRELLNAITGKNTRGIIDTLSQSLDQPLHDIDTTSNSLDALLKQLQKATEGLKNVEGQLTRKEKRLKTALEIAQDLVDKRLNLINWERRLKKHEQSINEISNRIGGSKDLSMINQQSDGSGFIESVLGSFFGKKDNENQEKERMGRVIKPSKKKYRSSSKLQRRTYTEEDWEKILVRLAPESEPPSSNASSVDDDEFNGKIDVRNSQFAKNNQQEQNKDEFLNETKDIESNSTIKSSPEVNQISQMDEYILLMEKQERMEEYLNRIGDNQQSIKDYLSKVNNNNGNNSAINSEYFRPIEEVRTEIGDDASIEKKFEEKENQTNIYTPTLATFGHLTNENLLETELNMKDSDSDSDWERLTSRFNGLSVSRNNIVNPKSTNRISKYVNKRMTKDVTPSNKFSKKEPTTGSLVRNADWEQLRLRIQGKGHLQKTPSWLNCDQDNKVNSSNSNFFVNNEGKLGGIFADVSHTSSTETVKNFRNGEIPKIKVTENSTHNNIGVELKSDMTNMESLNQKDSSLNLDYISRSFPAPVVPSENMRKDEVYEQMNGIMPQKEFEISKYNFEKNMEISTNIKNGENTVTIDNDNIDNGITRSSIAESGLDFAEVVSNLRGWKSFVSMVKGNIDKRKNL